MTPKPGIGAPPEPKGPEGLPQAYDSGSVGDLLGDHFDRCSCPISGVVMLGDMAG